MTETTRKRRFLRFSIKLAIALAVGFVAVEAGFRTVLFTDVGPEKLRRSLRKEFNYADSYRDDYWKLRLAFVDEKYHAPPKHYDATLGWRSRFVEADYTHQDDVERNGRRPVLLYGDSFAHCVTPREMCWQGLFEESELAEDYLFLNYGSPGFGFDQVYLQFRESIDLFAGDNPIVIISLLVDEDLDRSMLTIRGWPKPRFTLQDDGNITLDGPVAVGFAEYLEEHPLEILSYAWRYLVYGKKVLPNDWRRRIMGRGEIFARTRQLNRAILAEWRRELDARGLEHFAILFHSKKSLNPKYDSDWREPFFIKELERHKIPYLLSEKRLREHQKTSRLKLPDYYILEGDGFGHYTPLGNEVMFEMFRRGLTGDFDG